MIEFSDEAFPTKDAPMWLAVLRQAAGNELMANMQCVPIINDGTYKAVYEYIQELLARIEWHQMRERELCKEVEFLRAELYPDETTAAPRGPEER